MEGTVTAANSVQKKGRTVAIGVQDFEKLISNNCFYIDKTAFIREWWESNDGGHGKPRLWFPYGLSL